jgi:hypothetical protein
MSRSSIGWRGLTRPLWSLDFPLQRLRFEGRQDGEQQDAEEVEWLQAGVPVACVLAGPTQHELIGREVGRTNPQTTNARKPWGGIPVSRGYSYL